MMRSLLFAVLCFACLVVEGSARIWSPSRRFAVIKAADASPAGPIASMQLRGGAGVRISKKGKVTPQRQAMIAKVKEAFAQVEPATRTYLIATLFCTLVHLSGLPAPVLFALDGSKWYQLWRPITAVAYLGGPSMSMANSLYFLLRYGQTLETTNGTGAHAWFLLVQTTLLSLLGWSLGFPFQAQAMIAAIVYASSRVSPMEKMPIQFGIVITAWQLPFCMMIIDCLSQQNAAAAWPHILGIFSGHVYHFFTQVWPSLGGRAYLAPPKWFTDKLGGKPGSNIPGVDFRKNSKISRSDKGAGTDKASGGTSSLNRAKRKLFSTAKKGRKLD